MQLETDTMNATERIIATINHEEPDRVPCYVMGIPSYSKCYKEFLEREDDIFGDGGWGDDDSNILLTPMGDYTMKYYFGADVDMTAIGVKQNSPRFLLNEDGSLNTDQNASNSIPKGKEVLSMTGGKISGNKILETGESYSWYVGGYFKKKEDAIDWYETYGWLGDSPVSKANVEQYNAFQTHFGDRMYLVPQIGGVQLYESLWVIMGQARFGYYCRKDPDYILRLVNDRKQAQLNILDELARYKPIAIFGGDDMGQKGRPMMSPKVFRKFFKEAYREIFEKIHDMGAIAFNHSCGNITELLPDYIEAGLDGWQSLEPASLIDHAALKKKYGDTLLFVGGLDSREISFGNPLSVRKHVKEQICKMGKNGGYICGPTHDFLTETPLDNCIAMRDAIQQLGMYPL